MPIPSRHRRITRADLARPWLSVLRVVGIGALVLAVTAASLATIEVWSLGHTISDNSVDISNGSTDAPVSIGAIEGAFNVLMVGADNAADQTSFGEERDATLNDVNILVHIAADH